jgi:hypothetical protein
MPGVDCPPCYVDPTGDWKKELKGVNYESIATSATTHL